MRMLAAFLLLGAVVLFGQWLTGQERRHLQNTELLRDLAGQLEILLRCTCPPVTELMRTAADDNRFCSLGFLRVCLSGLENGMDFGEAWAAALRDCPVAVNNETAQKLLTFGGTLGKTDLAGQLKSCRAYEQYFDLLLTRERERYESYKRLCPPLCMAAGACLALLVL